MVAPDWLSTAADIAPLLAFVVFCLSLLVITVLAGQLLTLLTLFYRHRERGLAEENRNKPLPPDADLSHVLIQLPTFNEAAVVARALESAAALDWPRDRLHIQLLDDSTDETTEIARTKVEELRARGVDAMLLHRDNREGFKAGALAAGLAGRSDSYIAIFDADFIPPPDYLRRTVAELIADPSLCFVQGRWEHLNADYSLLTKAQSLSLDAHFAVEQSARSWSGLPMSFNGSGGIWRRTAIEDAGGWQYDTLTEDLDLSVRAWLRGWRSRFLVGLEVPGELPDTITAWRNQQFRWTKGFAQCAFKLLPEIWCYERAPATHKLALTIQFFQGWVYPAGGLALLMALLLVALANGVPRPEVVVGIFSSMIGLTAVFAIIRAAQMQVGRPFGIRTIIAMVAVLALNSGLAISNSRAIWEAVIGRQSVFVRTPKRGDGEKVKTKPSGSTAGIPELLLAFIAISVTVFYGAWYSPFMALTVTGLTVVGGAAFAAARGR